MIFRFWLVTAAVLAGPAAQATPTCSISHCRSQYDDLADGPHLEVWNKGYNEDPKCRVEGCVVDEGFRTFTLIRAQCQGISLDDYSTDFLGNFKLKSRQEFQRPTCGQSPQ
jgi:hypothetical protein